jgi:hypothetical protein
MRACNLKAAAFKTYSIEKGGKTFRMTFSKNLAEHILSKLPPGYKIKRRKMRIGQRLVPGQHSRTGLYCIATSKCSTPLRISLFRDAAAILSDENTRYIAEAIPL